MGKNRQSSTKKLVTALMARIERQEAELRKLQRQLHLHLHWKLPDCEAIQQLPEDMWCEVLKKLPARERLVLRCVSKAWLARVDEVGYTHLRRKFLVPFAELQQESSSWYTEEFLYAGVHWNLRVHHSPVRKVGIFLSYRKPAEAHVTVDYSLYLLNFDSLSKSIHKETQFEICPEKPEWGWMCFATIDDITSVRNGWLKEGSICVGVTIHSVEPSC